MATGSKGVLKDHEIRIIMGGKGRAMDNIRVDRKRDCGESRDNTFKCFKYGFANGVYLSWLSL